VTDRHLNAVNVNCVSLPLIVVPVQVAQ